MKLTQTPRRSPPTTNPPAKMLFREEAISMVRVASLEGTSLEGSH
jgi:hypothetical protein